MIDYLGNHVNVGDTVLIVVRSGRTAGLSRGYVKNAAMKPQFSGGIPTSMIEVEWSNIHKYWMPASRVVALPDYMLPEKRRKELNDTDEAVQPE